VNSFLETLKQLGPSRLGLMGAILVGLAIFFVFLTMRVSAPSMSLLYSDLNTTDSAAIAAKLEESNIPYEVSKDGAKIMASEQDIGRARMLLAAEGLPNGGSMGYEIFDKQSGFGTTSFVQNVNQVRALEGELARTIGSIKGVRAARVHLVLPQRQLFSREAQPPSASIFLNTAAAERLETEQVAAVQYLVASAVPGLKPSDVSIIDSTGKLLAGGGADKSAIMSSKAEEKRQSFERRLAEKIEDQVGRVVGFGKVRATVTAEMNFDQINTNEELFDPEGQVIRSTQTTSEKNKESENAGNQDVSVQNNLPAQSGNLLSGGSEPSSQGERTEEVTNFEISKTVRSTVREVGEIKRLSVAVLVDGSYAMDDKGTPDDKEDDVRTYKPRDDQELTRITDLVRSAAGYDERRGDTVQVVNMQFAPPETDDSAFVDERMLFGFEKSKLLDVAQIITVSIMIILVIMLVLQPMMNRLLAVPAPELDEKMEADLLAPRVAAGPALASPEMSTPMNEPEPENSLINVQGVEGKVKASTVKKVEEIVANYPNETVAVIRSWMTQET
jgi:flagellar M-ring protein FliF